MSITKILSDYSANLKLSDLPPDVVTRTRFLLLDLVGNIIRARYDAESTPAMLAAMMAARVGDGLPDDLLMAEMHAVEHADGQADLAAGLGQFAGGGCDFHRWDGVTRRVRRRLV